MRLYVDFETRSEADIQEVGSYVYAWDDTTEVQCLCLKIDDRPPQIWLPDRVKKILPDFQEVTTEWVNARAEEAECLVAHNAAFDRNIWGREFKLLPLAKWRCTMAKAGAAALPRSLDGAAEALGIPGKDAAGKKLMKAMCKPGKRGHYQGSADDYLKLIDYCRQDVEVLAAVDALLPDLPPLEQDLWVVDQQINDRGFAIDMTLVESLLEHLRKYEAQLQSELRLITGGAFSVRQVEAMKFWLKTKGLHLDDLQADTVEKALAATNLAPEVKRVLEIRQALSRSSVAKLERMRAMAFGKPPRVRGALVFNGADTGRWSGRGVQPHNLPREQLKNVGGAIAAAVLGDLVDLQDHGDPYEVASKLLRPCIVAAKGSVLTVADYSNIEGRVAAWFADETWKLDAFRAYDAGTGPDLYKLAYAKSFNIPVDKVDDRQRQIGKVQELALQYQGWVGAFQSMGKNYGVDLPKETVIDICSGWREAHPKIVAMWGALEQEALSVVEEGRDKKHSWFHMQDNWLKLRLPSGRCLSYYKPEVVEASGKKSLVYWSGGDGWQKTNTYGGCLFENIVQATARDLLAHAMLRLQKYDIVLHVHDELVIESETPKIDEMREAMAALPSWAKGIPIATKIWSGIRYGKE